MPGRGIPGGTDPRHLVAFGLIVVLAFLLSPAGANAVGQLVSIVDPDSQSKAQVDAGRLRVGDGDGALTVNGSVGVAGPVRVQNRVKEPLAIEDVNERSASPVQLGFDEDLAQNTTGVSSVVFDVPAGKRLVVETVAFSVLVPSGQFARASVSATNPSGDPITFSYAVPVQSEGTFNSRIVYTGLEHLRIYVEPGERLIVSVSRSGTTGEADARGAVSGHLVDVA